MNLQLPLELTPPTWRLNGGAGVSFFPPPRSETEPSRRENTQGCCIAPNSLGSPGSCYFPTHSLQKATGKANRWQRDGFFPLLLNNKMRKKRERWTNFHWLDQREMVIFADKLWLNTIPAPRHVIVLGRDWEGFSLLLTIDVSLISFCFPLQCTPDSRWKNTTGLRLLRLIDCISVLGPFHALWLCSKAIITVECIMA